MKALVVDDDAPTRAALSRVLTRDFDFSVTQVANGVDALSALTSQRFSLVLLDVVMPLMDGVETLEALRRSSEHASLPVVVISSSRDENQIRELIRLGISDYLTKPYRLSVVQRRLARVVQRLGVPEPEPEGTTVTRLLALDAPTRILVVDGDGDVRHFLVDVLGGRHVVLQADSAVAALKLCYEACPRVVFIGPNTGVLPPDLFARKLRSVPMFDQTVLVALAPRPQLEEMRAAAAFDGGVVRTFVPESFLAQLQQVSDDLARASGLLQRYPGIRGTLLSATEQVFGMMLGMEVFPVEEPITFSGPTITASIPLNATKSGAQELTIEVHAEVTTAKVIAAELMAMDAGAVSPAEMLAALGEIANIVAGRLHKALTDKGLHVSCGLPTTRISDDGAAEPRASVVLQICFSASSSPIRLRVDAYDDHVEADAAEPLPATA
jgi:CheY-like chemotaxis protein/CheY-specific phosphatase CheX